MKVLAQEAEAFREAGAIGAIADQPDAEENRYQWQKNELKEPVKEQRAFDFKNPNPDFEYSVGCDAWPAPGE